MRRRLIEAVFTILWGLAIAVLGVVVAQFLGLAEAEQGAVRIQGRTGQIAEVNHAGALQTTGGAASGGGDAVNVFHQSTIAHVSSVTHVRGSVQIISQSGAVVTVTGTSLDVNCTGCAAASVVNVGHISAMLHVSIVDFPRWAHMAVAESGLWTVQAHQAGVWNIGHVSAMQHVVIVDLPRWAHLQVSQSGTWTIQAAHQAGVWALSHISAMLHVAVVDLPRWAHLAVAQSGSWTVQAAHQGGTWVVNEAHASAVRHVVILDWQRWAHLGAAQSGSWTVQAAHQGGEWNVRHLSTAAHAYVLQAPSNRLGTHQTDAICLTCSARVTHRGGQMIEGFGSDATVLVATNAAPFNITHASSVRHVALVGMKPGSGHILAEVVGPHLTGAVHVSGISNIGSGNAGTGTTAMACHSTLAIHMAGSTNGISQIIHLTSSNGGVNQSTWRIYICGLYLWATNTAPQQYAKTLATPTTHAAAGVSLIEGQGTTCFTGRLPVLGAWQEGSIVLDHVQASLQVIAPFPWLSTNGPGNNLCLRSTLRAATSYVSGVITYRAGP